MNLVNEISLRSLAAAEKRNRANEEEAMRKEAHALNKRDHEDLRQRYLRRKAREKARGPV
jgi:hypothetical protein